MGRVYPQGWAPADEGRDENLEYRLTIFHAQKDDSGVFTCSTPTRHAHSVEIVVRPVHCAPLPNRHGLVASTNNTKLNTKASHHFIVFFLLTLNKQFPNQSKK